MKKEELFDMEATEANLELNEKMNDSGQASPEKGEEGVSSTTEVNLEIQEAFYGKKNKDDVLPTSTYMSGNTPAIKVSGTNNK